MRVVTYQVGVDCLGFPIYVEHRIYKVSTNPNSKFHKGTSIPLGVVVDQKTVKQH